MPCNCHGRSLPTVMPCSGKCGSDTTDEGNPQRTLERGTRSLSIPERTTIQNLKTMETEACGKEIDHELGTIRGKKVDVTNSPKDMDYGRRMAEERIVAYKSLGVGGYGARIEDEGNVVSVIRMEDRISSGEMIEDGLGKKGGKIEDGLVVTGGGIEDGLGKEGARIEDGLGKEGRWIEDGLRSASYTIEDMSGGAEKRMADVLDTAGKRIEGAESRLITARGTKTDDSINKPGEKRARDVSKKIKINTFFKRFIGVPKSGRNTDDGKTDDGVYVTYKNVDDERIAGGTEGQDGRSSATISHGGIRIEDESTSVVNNIVDDVISSAIGEDVEDRRSVEKRVRKHDRGISGYGRRIEVRNLGYSRTMEDRTSSKSMDDRISSAGGSQMRERPSNVSRKSVDASGSDGNKMSDGRSLVGKDSGPVPWYMGWMYGAKDGPDHMKAGYHPGQIAGPIQAKIKEKNARCLPCDSCRAECNPNPPCTASCAPKLACKCQTGDCDCVDNQCPLR